MEFARLVLRRSAVIAATATATLLGGCYYGYPAYPPYPVVSTAYTQREFTVPASGATVATASSATLPPQYEYAIGALDPNYSNYYQTYPYPYAGYPYYPAYGGYPAYYGYAPVSFSFGYWGGGGCCWGRGWRGGGYYGHGGHGGGGWHGGGGYGHGWQGGGGWHGGGGGHGH
ncbi:hypothetical protein QCE62_04765 [Caballeronia sp. LZ033]|uniref:hypothetical protein n=1 Tax=Caballeronia sp. LZ033 TaxID=3038566 RepID=UPI0028621EA0|nr:hypothetical protein [Caballeronia sp. LZ033]MDR5812901.1 hypothetical protein [Caballeronia sp. LZ033]